MTNEEVLNGVKEETNSLHTVRIRETNWIDHNVRGNCLMKHVVEEKTQGRI